MCIILHWQKGTGGARDGSRREGSHFKSIGSKKKICLLIYMLKIVVKSVEI